MIRPFAKTLGALAILAVAAMIAGSLTTGATPAYAGATTPSAPAAPFPDAQPGASWSGKQDPFRSSLLVATNKPTPPPADSRRECIDDAIAPIHVINTRLRRPRPNGQEALAWGQKAFARIASERMPSNCASQFHIGRDLRFEFKVGGVPFLGITFGISNAGYVNGGANEVVRMPGQDPPTKWQITRGIYKCAPGPKQTHVWFLSKAIAMDPRYYGVTNWHVVREKVFTPLPVRHILPRPC